MNLMHLFEIAKSIYKSDPLAFDLLGTAAIKFLPPPNSKFLSWRTWYAWFYETAHQYVNTTPRPTSLADPPANPKP